MQKTRQQNVFTSLIHSFGEAEKVMNRMSTASGTMATAQKAYLDSIEGRANQAKAVFQSVSQTLINSDAVKSVISLGTAILKVVDALAKVNAILPITVGLVATISNAKKAYGRESFVTELIQKAGKASSINSTSVLSYLAGADPTSYQAGISALTGEKGVPIFKGVSKEAIDSLVNGARAQALLNSEVLKSDAVFAGLDETLAGADLTTARRALADAAAAGTLKELNAETIKQALLNTELSDELKAVIVERLADAGAMKVQLTWSQRLGRSLKAVGASLKSLAANPITWVAAGIAAVAVAVKLYQQHLQNIRNEAEKSRQESENLKTTVSDLNDQLKTTQDRIKALQALETPSIADEDELKTLKETNDELERKLRIEQAMADQAAQKAESDSLKQAGISSNNVPIQVANGGVPITLPEGSRVVPQNPNMSDLDAFNAYLAAAQQEKDRLSALLYRQSVSPNDKDIQAQIASVRGNLDNYNQKLSELYGSMQGYVDGISGLTEEGKAYLSQYGTAISTYDTYLQTEASPSSYALPDASTARAYAKETLSKANNTGRANPLQARIDALTDEQVVQLEKEVDLAGQYSYTKWSAAIDKVENSYWGNVSKTTRPVILWTDENIEKYKAQLESLGIAIESLRGGESTLLGGSAAIESGKLAGQEIMYTPILPDGTLLDKETLTKYLQQITSAASSEQGILAADKAGMLVGNTYVQGIVEGITGAPEKLKLKVTQAFGGAAVSKLFRGVIDENDKQQIVSAASGQIRSYYAELNKAAGMTDAESAAILGTLSKATGDILAEAVGGKTSENDIKAGIGKALPAIEATYQQLARSAESAKASANGIADAWTEYFNGGTKTAQQATRDFTVLNNALAAAADDSKLLDSSIKAIGNGTFLSDDNSSNLEALISKFPQLTDELAAYANGTMTAEQLTSALYTAMQDYRADAMYMALDNVTKALYTYGAESNQFLQSVQVLSNYIPGLVDALYDQETATWKVDTAAFSSSQSILDMCAAQLKANYLAAKTDFSKMIEQYNLLVTASGRAYISVVAANGAIEDSRIGYDEQSESTALPGSKKAADAFKKAAADYTNGMSLINDVRVRAQNEAAKSKTSESGSSADPLKDGFESARAALDREKDKLEAGLAWNKLIIKDLSDYYTKLEALNNKYYKGRSGYEDEYTKGLIEVFNGRKEIMDADISDLKDKISTLENTGANEGRIITTYRDIQKTAHSFAEQYRKAMKGQMTSAEIENSEFIKKMQKEWWDAQTNIVDTLSKIANASIDSVKGFMNYADNFDLWNDLGLTKLDYLRKTVEEINQQYRLGNLALDERNKLLGEANTDVYNEQKDVLDYLVEQTMALIKAEKEAQIKALDEQVKKYKEIVDLKKESLQTTYDELKYQREINDKNAEMSDLQKQIDQLSLDDSREAAAKRISLQEDLSKLQKELAEKQAEHTLNLQQDSLDDSYDAFEKEKESEKEKLQAELDDERIIYQQALARINTAWQELGAGVSGLWDTLFKGITDNTKAWGADLDDIINKLNSAKTLSNYGDVSGAYTGIKKTGYDSLISQNVDHMEANSSLWWGKWKSGDKAGANALAAENESIAMNIQQLLNASGKNAQIIKDNASGKWYIVENGSKKELFKTYHEGGVVGDGTPIAQDEVFALLKKGEWVFDKEKQSSLIDQANTLSTIADKMRAFFKGATPGVPAMAGGYGNIAPIVNISIDGTGGLSEQKILDASKKGATQAIDMIRSAFSKRGY